MGTRILLVDDNKLFLQTTKNFLEHRGYEVATASSWLDFTEAFYATPNLPTAILFDIDLGPTLPGDKLLSVFKRGRSVQPHAAKAKLILFSSLPEPEVAQRAKQAGADGYIPKQTLTLMGGEEFIRRLEDLLK